MNIEFRGKHTGTDKFVYGDLFHDIDEQQTYIKSTYHFAGDQHDAPCDYQQNHPVNAETIGQYIGIHDKTNGKKIFQGDILYIAGIGDCVVVWDFGLLGYGFKDEKDDIHDYQDVMEDIECVIGNIYDD